MPQKIVEVPGLGNVEFPDSMDDGAIAVAIQKQLHPPEATLRSHMTRNTPQAPQSMLNAIPGSHPADPFASAGGMLISPVTGLLSAPGEIMDWAKRGFTNPPSGGDMGNPIHQAYGAMVGSILSAHPRVAKVAGENPPITPLESRLGRLNPATVEPPPLESVSDVGGTNGPYKVGIGGKLLRYGASKLLHIPYPILNAGIEAIGNMMRGPEADAESAGRVVPPPRLPSHGTSPFNPENQAVQPVVAPPSSRLSTSPFNPQAERVTPPPPLRHATGISNEPPASAARITPPPPLRHATGISNQVPEVQPITAPPALRHATGISNEPATTGERVTPPPPLRFSTSPFNPAGKTGKPAAVEPVPAPPTAPIQPITGEPTAGAVSGVQVESLPQQKAHDMIGDWQKQKTEAAAAVAFDSLNDAQFQALLKRQLSKADLDSLLQRTTNPRSGAKYTATSETPKNVGRNAAWIQEQIAQAIERMISGGKIPPVRK